MVVSGGYANSEAAAKVWKLLYPGREAALRKIVWLEFAGKQWDASVIPMLLVIEKARAQEDDEIELLVPSKWKSDEASVKIKYVDFFDMKISPRVTKINLSDTAEGLWGDYLLPLLHSGDIPILRKLYSSPENGLCTLSTKLKWTFGIQRGGVPITDEASGDSCIPVLAGQSLSIGWKGDIDGWVDLDAVKSRPNGKQSLWKTSPYPRSFIGVSKITLALTAVVFSDVDVAVLDSVTVGIWKQGCSGNYLSLGAYLSSKLVRYYTLIRLRSTVLEGSHRSQHHPRVLQSLPWIENLQSEFEDQLAQYYNELARLATLAKNNPNEWLLSEVETRIETSRYKLSDRNLGLNFSNWSTEDVYVEELTLDGNCIRAGLFSLELVDADVAELVYKLLTLNAEEETTVSRAIIQKLLVPQDYSALVQGYRQHSAIFQQVESNFFAVLNQIDETVYKMFGLTDDEKTHIENRLASFPLNKLKPRYPWQTVKPRPIKAYTSDRFA
jgi:hypothetical protein